MPALSFFGMRDTEVQAALILQHTPPAMDKPIFFILTLAIAPMLLWMGLWTVYVIGFRDLAKVWFGELEGYRRDYEAVSRRQNFENCCWWSAKFLYGAWIVGLLRGLLSERLSDISWMFWATQIALLIIGILCVWAAVSRVRAPHEN